MLWGHWGARQNFGGGSGPPWNPPSSAPEYKIECFHPLYHTGGLRPQSGSWSSFCGAANSSLNSFLKSRIFRTSYINILLHQQNRNTDRSLWSSHYLHHNSYLISPTQLKSTWFRIESCAERVNPHGLWVTAFAGQVREPALQCMLDGRRMGNSLCVQLHVEPKHMNLISSKIAKHVDVLKLFGSIALRPVSPEQLLHYDVTTLSCETLAHALVMW